MDNLDWNQLNAFLETAETGSLSAAARKLGLTQPTLSRQVAAIEQRMGVTLFERAGKAMALTPTGLDLLEHARAMGTSAEALRLAATGRSQAVGGVVSVSATDVVAAYLLPPLARLLREKAPGIAIRHVKLEQPDLISCYSDHSMAHWALVRHGMGIGAMMAEIARDTPGIIRVLDDVPPVRFPIWHPASTCRSRTGGSGQSAQQGQPRVVGATLRDAQILVELTVNRLTGNQSPMPIQSFACSDTEGLFTTGKCRRFVNTKSVAERKLAQLDAAPSVSFMKAPPGNDLKEHDGAWHVRINDQWRLTFKWGERGPYDLFIARAG